MKKEVRYLEVVKQCVMKDIHVSMIHNVFYDAIKIGVGIIIYEVLT